MDTGSRNVLLNMDETSLTEAGVLNPNYADNNHFYGTMQSDPGPETQSTEKQTTSGHVTKRKETKAGSNIKDRFKPMLDGNQKYKKKKKLQQGAALVGALVFCALIAFGGAMLAIYTLDKHEDPAADVTNDVTDYNVRFIQSAGVLPQQVCAPYSNATQKVFTNLDYAAFGYNYLAGYPLTVGHDPGLTHPIFTVTYKDNKKTADCSYSVPDGYDVIRDVSCATGFTSDVITTSRQFSKAVSHSASAHFGIFGFSFSANAQYKTDVTEISNSQIVYVLSQAKCQQFFSQLNAFNPPPFHPTFMAWIQKLQNSTDKRDYLDFITYYGTHFITETAFGAQYMKLITMATKSYQEMKSRNINVQAQASLSILFFHGGASYDFSEAEKQEIKNFRSHVSERTISKGAPPPQGFNTTKWAHQAFTTPVPISYHLTPLDQLFTDKYMDRLPAGLNIDYDNIRENLLRIMTIDYRREIFDRSTNMNCRSLMNPFKLPRSFCFDTKKSKMVGKQFGGKDCDCLETSDCLGETFGSSGSDAVGAHSQCHVLFRLSHVAENSLLTSAGIESTDCHSYLFPYRLSSNYGQSNQPDWLRVRGVTSDKVLGHWISNLNGGDCEKKCVADVSCVAVVTMTGGQCGLFDQSQIQGAKLQRSEDERNMLAFVKVC